MCATNLKWILCPGQNPTDLKSFRDIYKFWRVSWQKAYADLNLDSPLYSDKFTRQDLIGALEYKGTIIASVFFKGYAHEEETYAEDSYFKNWPQEHRLSLFIRGPNIVTSTQLTVHPLARGTNLGFPTKELMTGLCAKTLLESTYDTMAVATRQDRNVHLSCLNWGAVNLATDVDSGYGDLVSLQAYYKTEVANAYSKHTLSLLCNSLWSGRTDIFQKDSFSSKLIKAG